MYVGKREMGKLRKAVGPLAVVALLFAGAGIGVAAYVAQAEPEPHVPTSLPLARI